MALRIASRRFGGRALAAPLEMMKHVIGPKLAQCEKFVVQGGFSPRFRVFRSSSTIAGPPNAPHSHAKVTVESSGGPTFVRKPSMPSIPAYAYSPLKKVAVEGGMQPTFIHKHRMPAPSGCAKLGFNSSFSSNSMQIQRSSISSAKVVMGCASRPGFIRTHAMSTSSSASAPPAEEFTLYIMGGRMATKEDINRGQYRVLISGNENLCLASFWFFGRIIDKDRWSDIGMPFIFTKFHRLSVSEVDYQVELMKLKKSSALYAKMQLCEQFMWMHMKSYCFLMTILMLVGIGEICDWTLPGGRRILPPTPPSDQS